MSGPRLFVLDNYDSFTFNLVQYLGELGATIEVARNDETTPEAIAARHPDGVIISPGPGAPAGAGISVALVRLCAERRIPLLGVCLGHQAVGEAFGGHVRRAGQIMHGKVSDVHHEGASVLAGLVSPLVATRYHSLVLDPDTLPEELRMTAWTDDGVVMGLAHLELPIHGVQFHPESVLTTEGMRLLGNFLGMLPSPASEAHG